MGASCDGCPNYKVYRESRGEFWGASCSEEFAECRAIDNVISDKLVEKLIDYFENDNDKGCPLFNDKPEDKDTCRWCDYYTYWPDESRECAVIEGSINLDIFVNDLDKVKQCFKQNTIINCPCFIKINEDNS